MNASDVSNGDRDQAAVAAPGLPHRHVFIISYGRSGSTLLMNLINSSPECIVRGENNGALYALFESYSNIVEAQFGRETSSTRQTSSWWGIAQIDTEDYARQLAAAFVRSVIRPSAGHTMCGFKEVRYTIREAPDLEGFVDFLKRFFPGTKIVFNYRDLDQVAKSKWWSDMPDAANILKEAEARFKQFSDPQLYFHFSYDTALRVRSHVEALFSFLELPFDRSAVDEVFSVRHSY